jgi:N-acetylmuramoyl-L-alanine amidase
MSRAIAKAVLGYKSSLDGTLFTGEIRQDEVVSTKSSESNPLSNAPIFKVQIAASTKKIATEAYNFKGLAPISSSKSGNIYRYYYGNFASYKQARKAIATAVQKGYKGAYVKAFVNDKEVSITREMKSN